MVTLRSWNVLESLDCEGRIAGFLEAVLEEGGARALPGALAKAAQARAINRLAEETGIDRKTLCGVFLEESEKADPPLSQELIVKVAKAFVVTAPASPL